MAHLPASSGFLGRPLTHFQIGRAGLVLPSASGGQIRTLPGCRGIILVEGKADSEVRDRRREQIVWAWGRISRI
jgi:hypothetical protein